MWILLLRLGALVLLTSTGVLALPYDPDQVDHNLNQNVTATNPLDYAGSWPNHTYNPSPPNWRFPVYTLFLDKFVNGDPTNDDANVSLHRRGLLRARSSQVTGDRLRT